MKKFAFLIFPLLISSCSKEDQSNHDITESKQEADRENYLGTVEPAFTDSSSWIIYPLSQHQENTYGRSSKSDGWSAYWNVAFYNILTGETRLLEKEKSVLISSVIPPSGMDYNRTKETRNLILYIGIIDDLDQDKELTRKDPTYLFVSGPDGSAFRRISPKGYDLISWKVNNPSGKVFMYARPDKNGDQIFDKNDGAVAFVSDLYLPNGPVPVFNEKFNREINSLYQKFWTKKDE